ncbi:indole-3-glycerol phosphate synthase TrpC [Pseudobacteriovorax antillogorgiicola]|uniref:Indole-3-glycerol phosphate synthase n=1 Tax=Pseudobacteriovorax antillogorgiicola TaxID=1513793 RepID=A0A1Y6B5Q6_9BACT|nr:indole-3-glycerol phosphate synthase TrpC [Pseudobacteriovorax antillogorgiicola]TCS58881.1 indole-3-glycerol phosphate synthase [Pseudobacteriovorax antillogorgiicola]SME93677.1 indole-3-glycerol phosphate synthase [Pseudobacteriovorax antillogorgiicola]
MSESILHKIGATVQRRIDDLKTTTSLAELKEQAGKRSYKPQDFTAPFREADRVSVIAEFKRASPSKGDIAPELKPLDVAGQYLDAGATALSILTEPSYFRGDLDYIRQIRSAHPKARILMKDFFVDEYQLYQALDAGADAILIIVGLLGKERALELHSQAQDLGLTTLVEVHDEQELACGLSLQPDLLGVNNRDLRDLSITLETSRRLKKLIPDDQLAISESGIETLSDIKSLQSIGYQGFLVGTSLMKTGTPGSALKKLIEG